MNYQFKTTVIYDQKTVDEESISKLYDIFEFIYSP